MVDGAALLAILPDLTLPADYQIVIGAFEEPKMREVVYDMLRALCPGADIVEQRDDEMWLFFSTVLCDACSSASAVQASGWTA